MLNLFQQLKSISGLLLKSNIGFKIFACAEMTTDLLIFYDTDLVPARVQNLFRQVQV